ncbi:hypothetical protein TRICI_004966 [Trichomonascus ciferrii]|uniref:Exocyst complex component EXO84 n=1 Tax=Trichomonascus ciferrii TaxID=44093 RepID=A0A642UZG1_9ASCO|nr:hypothetical protein TRICI_004966 [Trichomonascus ciferrii]
MEDDVQGPQSLRKHRQTLMPPDANGGRGQKKGYGQLAVPGQGELPSVTQRDKEKVGNLVKKRFSSRPQVEDIYAAAANDEVPALPTNAADMIQHAGAQPSRTQQQQQQPPQPQKPVTQPQTDGRRPSEGRRDRGVVDKDVFLSQKFDAEAYIANQLGAATDVEISRFADKLASLQANLAQDKKDAMYRNYKTFLAVGNEIGTLGSELDQLRKLLNDLHIATTAMKEDADQFLAAQQPKAGSQLSVASVDSSSGSMKRSNSANRNSMLMLENMWAQELASLFKHVEGAQKYLPAVPGRHVIKESGGWYQLNAATWKPLQPVHLFLLNDHLLVATKKRHRQGENTLTVQPQRRLVADQCWPLQEIKLYDLDKQYKTGQQPGSTLCVRVVGGGGSHNNSFVFRTEKSEGGATLLAEFHRAREELKKHMPSKAETQLRHQDSMNYYAKETPSLSRNPNLLDHFTAARRTAHSRDASLDITGRTRSLREIDELMNDLDVKIAYRQFPDAVELIEKNLTTLEQQQQTVNAQTASSAERLVAMSTTAAVSADIAASASDELASQVLRMKLEQRVQELTDVLLHELSQDYLSRDEVQANVQLLISLRAGDKAKHTLLDSRRNLIRRRVKEVEFQGDIVGYITQVAIIHFRMVRSTIEIFAACYRDAPGTSSSLVEWAKNEIDSYILLFARQLFNITPESETYQACANVTRQESEQLKEVGLDLSFMLSPIYDANSDPQN